MTPKRGEVVTVAATGDFGKPRPAVVIRSDVFPEQHASVIVCRMASRLEGAPDFRLALEPSRANGLREISRIMADKPMTVRRERIGSRIGRLDRRDMTRLNSVLAFVSGLADWTGGAMRQV